MEDRRGYYKQWYKANKKHHKAKQTAWQRNNPDKKKIYNQNYRKKMAEQTLEIENILKSSEFEISVGKILAELRKKRRERPDPPPGRHYKRDWYDRMREQDQLNTDFFLTNIKDIWHKKSDLNSETRALIEAICNKALVEIINNRNKNESKAKE